MKSTPTIRRSPPRWLRTSFAFALALATLAGTAHAQQADSSGDLPVILLTGFEPFGVRKLPNPSWQGIKELDGQVWNGHRLVCKQLPVVWGEPLKLLDTWIEQYQPRVVLSLGQGGTTAFTVESYASIDRDGARDNRGQQPPRTNIVEDGPQHFEATANYKALQDKLVEQGYRTRLSGQAGKYLCEEALYSLEYLKWKKHPALAVAFCHVPPLGTQLADQTVNAAYVQAFALEVLGGLVEQAAPNGNPDQAAPKNKQEQQIEAFTKGYFKSWSTGQFDQYDDCFLPNAVIQLIMPDGRLASMPRKAFVAQQRQYVQSTTTKPVEVPTSIKISYDADMVRVLAYWKLTSDSEVTYGYDHFTLVERDGKWKIVHLLFYGDER